MNLEPKEIKLPQQFDISENSANPQSPLIDTVLEGLFRQRFAHLGTEIQKNQKASGSKDVLPEPSPLICLRKPRFFLRK